MRFANRQPAALAAGGEVGYRRFASATQQQLPPGALRLAT